MEDKEILFLFNIKTASRLIEGRTVEAFLGANKCWTCL